MNLLQDLNVLTNIPEKSLSKLVNVSINSICTGAWEALNSEEDVLSVDIGLGILYIKLVDEDFKYHFVPSDTFSKELKNSKTSQISPLSPRLLGSLKTKFLEVYKDIC